MKDGMAIKKRMKHQIHNTKQNNSEGKKNPIASICMVIPLVVRFDLESVATL